MVATGETGVVKEDRRILRDLARRVAEIAAQPIQAERTRQWKALSSLKPERPMVLAFNEDVGGGTRSPSRLPRLSVRIQSLAGGKRACD